LICPPGRPDSRWTDATNVKLRTLPVGLSTFITGDVYLQRYVVEGLTAGSVKG